MITILSENNSIFNQFLSEIRDERIQRDSMRFRNNMERMGEIFAYEISKTLIYSPADVKTPLGISNMRLPQDTPVLAPLLRAGLPLHQGFLKIFDKAENAFISPYRNYDRDGTFDLQLGYLSSPDIDNKVVILIDALIATGSSIELAYKSLLSKGRPRYVHIVSTIASRDGLNYIRKHLPSRDISLWLGAVDDELTVRSFVVPGLGDAGDLAYGEK
jgi:uracil phosphoribosyltransferase